MNHLHLKVKSLENMMISRATGNEVDDKEYISLRNELIKTSINKLLPEFVITCRDIGQFWQYIKYEYTSYRERRDFIWGKFKIVYEHLEKQGSVEADNHVSQNIVSFDMDYIRTEWRKSLERIIDDPEGAITSARSLIETTCKYILDKYDIKYDDDIKLPQLYKLAAKQLNLAPEQHQEPIFKQILGGCFSVVSGLGSLRNKLGDSHGKGITQTKPSSRHAALAVNLSGEIGRASCRERV